MIRKPKIFIGSSSESLNVAEAINVILDHEIEVTIWRNGFDLSQITIESLILKANTTDFALFVFSPDDITLIRQQEKQVVRDNVLFELGLFIGAIGKERCFILKPRGEELHLPSDLAGLTYADYEANRSDNDLASAVNAACTKMKQSINKIGNRAHIASSKNDTVKPILVNDVLNNLDKIVLMGLLCTFTESPEGYGMYQIKNRIQNDSDLIDLSIIKLLKLNYIDRSIEEYNNSAYFTYRITEIGLDILINSNKISEDEIPF